jgi:hypothetical protein
MPLIPVNPSDYDPRFFSMPSYRCDGALTPVAVLTRCEALWNEFREQWPDPQADHVLIVDALHQRFAALDVAEWVTWVPGLETPDAPVDHVPLHESDG